MKQSVIKFVLVAAAAFAAATGAHAQQGKSLKVEVQVFSGRPNPTFTITDPQEIRDILDTASTLPQGGEEEAETHGKLGYQGLLITNETGEAPEVKSVRVRGSSVALAKAVPGAAKGKVAVTNRRDSSHGLEARLLAHAKEKGFIDEKLSEAIENSR